MPAGWRGWRCHLGLSGRSFSRDRLGCRNGLELGLSRRHWDWLGLDLERWRRRRLEGRRDSRRGDGHCLSFEDRLGLDDRHRRAGQAHALGVIDAVRADIAATAKAEPQPAVGCLDGAAAHEVEQPAERFGLDGCAAHAIAAPFAEDLLARLSQVGIPF